ncbi:hypothetical protein JCM4814A_94680 [Streptomyces phaeofaciens JCM 4814]|uniref:Uncharacterized protein n=1 Tax=Streptomyces phaeofaciens TaxID=68254 RepID=A0A918M116_9ACTN|nr:hypothetical protein [Streptomyces phaeofaciens]GGT97327.1 hypothetical protein GCM10010226_88420 [Streptomyces phaeofaciens]
MSNTNRDVVAVPHPASEPETAVTAVLMAASPPTPVAPVQAPARITLAHTLPPTVSVAGGIVLSITKDMPTAEILELIGGCGLIGAGVVALITGGRHLGAAVGRAGRAMFSKNA